MGLVLAAVAVAVIIGGAALAYMFAGKGGGQQPDMSPSTMDDMDITQAAEGSVVPVVYGRVRLAGNIIWYENLNTVAETQEVETGKGGSDEEDVITGYHYYLDVWQAVCRGKISWIATYVQDELKNVNATLTLKNDGTQNTFPSALQISFGDDTPPGENANKLPGIAHVFYRKLYLGLNATNAPTIHFIVEKDLTGIGVTDPEIANGSNPHAIIYDILLEAGALSSQIDIDSFNAAGQYWKDKGYGLNLKFTRQSKAKEKIAFILKMLGGAFGVNHENKFILKAFDENDTSSATINTEDWLEFQFARRTWFDTFNEFRCNYVDQNQHYSQRTLIARNPANTALQGKKSSVSIDLSGFRSKLTAAKRLWEIMKKESYPYAKIKGSTSLKLYETNVGDIVTINNSEYNIADAEFRVVVKDISEIDQNKIGWELEQFSETLFDDYYGSGGFPGGVRPVTVPEKLIHQGVYEIPYNPATEYHRVYLLFAARENNFEAGFEVLFSATGVDYTSKGIFNAWSQYGTLDEAYTINTYTIDDEIGILYTPYRDDPQFATGSRTDLFVIDRYLLIDDEIMKFQTVTAEGPGSYRLTGVIRGMFNTIPATHGSGSSIWLFNLSASSMLRNISSSDFYLKFLPYYKSKKVDPGDATAIHVTTVYNRAKQPWIPTAIKAVRSGSDVTLTIYTTTQTRDGAGKAGAASQTDYVPTSVDDKLEVYDSDEGSGASQLLTSGADSRSNAGAFTYYARQKNGTFTSSWVSVYVDTADGIYWS